VAVEINLTTKPKDRPLFVLREKALYQNINILVTGLFGRLYGLA